MFLDIAIYVMELNFMLLKGRIRLALLKVDHLEHVPS
jgi:hypothetical protein